MKRKIGYYRVMLHGNWIIAEYIHNEWYICGVESPFNDFSFDKINETPINPQP